MYYFFNFNEFSNNEIIYHSDNCSFILEVPGNKNFGSSRYNNIRGKKEKQPNNIFTRLSPRVHGARDMVRSEI